MQIEWRLENVHIGKIISQNHVLWGLTGLSAYLYFPKIGSLRLKRVVITKFSRTFKHCQFEEFNISRTHFHAQVRATIELPSVFVRTFAWVSLQIPSGHNFAVSDRIAMKLNMVVHHIIKVMCTYGDLVSKFCLDNQCSSLSMCSAVI